MVCKSETITAPIGGGNLQITEFSIRPSQNPEWPANNGYVEGSVAGIGSGEYQIYVDNAFKASRYYPDVPLFIVQIPLSGKHTVCIYPTGNISNKICQDITIEYKPPPTTGFDLSADKTNDLQSFTTTLHIKYPGHGNEKVTLVKENFIPPDTCTQDLTLDGNGNVDIPYTVSDSVTLYVVSGWLCCPSGRPTLGCQMSNELKLTIGLPGLPGLGDLSKYIPYLAIVFGLLLILMGLGGGRGGSTVVVGGRDEE